ncbi:hypothetical protein MKZ38_009382 [Zalerion maritima]|uniref:Uncharacterized protein n=1 Tax=Zalerion maritima TaxID=339359 RepID=A0AAD5WNK8_9PEZI|nr:hypothetical protein MKZ38_009382 [Zalerion maritima]
MPSQIQISHDQHQDSTTPLLPSHTTTTNTTSQVSKTSSSSSSSSPAKKLAKTSANMLNTVVSGATFGAALVASGVYQPSVIIGQLKLENWHMLQAFLTATASSA